jgi:serine/threonine protein kinase
MDPHLTVRRKARVYKVSRGLTRVSRAGCNGGRPPQRQEFPWRNPIHPLRTSPGPILVGIAPNPGERRAEPGEPAAEPGDSRTEILPPGSPGPSSWLGRRIDRYHLLEVLGEGGMGTVYPAEQESPMRRRVALKLVKLGMDNGEVIARFEAERQALAMMDHPNVAKVYDAGTTESGRPYFVMELVEGIRIDRYCDEHRLTIAQRLQLFTAVCRGVHHAHQKGVIHRDVKPSNILVCEKDGRPLPKVIDFGVAKATGPDILGGDVVTRLGRGAHPGFEAPRAVVRRLRAAVVTDPRPAAGRAFPPARTPPEASAAREVPWRHRAAAPSATIPRRATGPA